MAYHPKNVKERIIHTSSGVECSFITQERITKPEQLLEYIGYDKRFWVVEKMDVGKWESAAYDRNKGKWIISDLWKVIAKLKPIQETQNIKAICDEIIKNIKLFSPSSKKYKYKTVDKNSYLCEIDLFDVHFGKLVWGLESGKNYDIKIARETYKSVFNDLLTKVSGYSIERFLFPIGNDFFNVNGISYATFNGTRQHEDQRWQKTFREGCKLLADTMNMLVEIAPVNIVIVPGNHDTEPSFYAGEVLSAIYHNNPNITVDNSPTIRKYYKYGKCLIGFTHGCDEKPQELPLIMATERPKEFSETLFREWHIGHYHHKKEYSFLSANEYKGITVRTLRALTAIDAWHNKKGYVGSLRSGEAFLWSKDNGLVANISVFIP